MWNSVGEVFLAVIAALALLLLPGMALLRWCVPPRRLDLVSRLSLAPGVTIAFCILLFTWCKLLGLKLPPLTPWILIALAGVGYCLAGGNPSRRQPAPLHAWVPHVALGLLLAILLITRFQATWGWSVPPGIDSPQHSLIVQLLLEHRGLFDSWGPSSDAETFTYHFGFHAIATLFAWMWGTDGAAAVFLMARLMGVCAAAALVPIVRLWTRSTWGGVFAVAVWALHSRQLQSYDLPGRWTLLTGFAAMSPPLVLLTIYLRSAARRHDVLPGLLCAVTAAGLVLAQYKTGIIFAVLAGAFFVYRVTRALVFRNAACQAAVVRLSSRSLLFAAVAIALAAPRLAAVMEAKTGRVLQRAIFEAPPANPAAFGAPKSSLLQLAHPFYATLPKAALAVVTISGALALLLRCRRGAPWYVLGWLALLVVMNPSFIGLQRAGLLDEIYWTYVMHIPIAVVTGVAVGLCCGAFQLSKRLSWNLALGALALGFSAWNIARLPPVPASSRFVLPDDLRLMAWIREHIPPDELIAGRAHFDYEQPLGYDAVLWLPYFTGHQTQHTNLAAAIERADPEFRARLKTFTRELYTRDMSTEESAAWMREQGFRWFFAGAQPPEVAGWIRPEQPERDRRLLAQLSRNPRVRLAQGNGQSRLFAVD